MDLFKRVFLLVYLFLMLGAGALFTVVSLETVDIDTYGLPIFAENFLDLLTNKIPMGAVIGGIFAVVGLITFYGANKNLTRNKQITFHNPDGEVTVSIAAVESYVRRVARDIPGIRDARSSVKVVKKGVKVVINAILAAGTHIPEATERIQMTVRGKLQDMIGAEENIDIKMNVTKIIKDAEPESRYEENKKESAPSVPYRDF